MNNRILLIISFFLVACASPIEQKPSAGLKKETTRNQFVGTFIPTRDEDIAVPEQIKAYRVGRYVDLADFNTLHERHTIYRREQTGHWNLAAAKGASAARSYYLTADRAQQTQQQKAYYAAAQEQVRVAKEKLATTEQRMAALEKENSSLREKTRPSRIYDPIQQHP